MFNYNVILNVKTKWFDTVYLFYYILYRSAAAV